MPCPGFRLVCIRTCAAAGGPRSAMEVHAPSVNWVEMAGVTVEYFPAPAMD